MPIKYFSWKGSSIPGISFESGDIGLGIGNVEGNPSICFEQIDNNGIGDIEPIPVKIPNLVFSFSNKESLQVVIDQLEELKKKF